MERNGPPCYLEIPVGDGSAKAFHPYPPSFTFPPSQSCVDCLRTLLQAHHPLIPVVRFSQFLDSIVYRAQQLAAFPTVAARGHTFDELVAIVAYTADIRDIGLKESDNFWYQLNAILRARNAEEMLPYLGWYWHLTQGFSKIPAAPPSTELYRGLKGVLIAFLSK